MEAKIYRLIIALSVIAAIGFGIAGALAMDTSRRAHKNVKEYLKLEKGCWGKPAAQCNRQVYFELAESEARRGGEARAEGHAFLGAAAGIPASLFLLFFVGRWILTGKMRTVRVASPNTASPD